jgi:hypothetical protein
MNFMSNEEISYSPRSQILQVSEHQTAFADFEAQSHSEGLLQCRAHTSEKLVYVPQDLTAMSTPRSQPFNLHDLPTEILLQVMG